MNEQERGSEIVQFVVTVPLLLLALFATMQVGGMMLAISQVSSDIATACRQIDAAGLELAADKEAFLKSELLGEATQLIPANLQVSGVVLSRAHEKSAAALAANEALVQRTGHLEVSFGVTYKLASLAAFPGLEGKVLKRTVTFGHVDGRVVEVEVTAT